MANTIIVSSGQSLDHKTFDNSGVVYQDIDILRGGTAAYDQLIDNELLTVRAGGSISHIIAGPDVFGDSMIAVQHGGYATDITVTGGGNLNDYGLVRGAVIASNGYAMVDYGGRLIGGNVDGGSLDVIGTVSDVTVRDGNEAIGPTVVVSNAAPIGSSFDVRLTDGSKQYVEGGLATSSFLIGGSTQEVGNDGTAVATTLGFDAIGYVYNGGHTEGVTVDGGGTQIVASGGSLDGATVLSGGVLLILPGGSASDVTAQAGAEVISGGVVTLDSAGRVLGFHQQVGGRLPVAFSTREYVLSGGVVHAQTVSSGGQEVVYSGGLSEHQDVHGYLQVDAGGIADNVFVAGYSEIYDSLVYETGAQGTNVDVGKAGRVFIHPGATVDRLTISAGGFATVEGAVNGLQIDSGGRAFVTDGGVVHGAMVGSGGVLEVDGRTRAQLNYPYYQGDGRVHGIDLLQGGTLEFTELHYSRDATVTLGPNNLLTVTQPRGFSGTERSFSVHLAGDYTGATFAISDSRDGLDAITRTDHVAAAIPVADLVRDIASVGDGLPPAREAPAAGGFGTIGADARGTTQAFHGLTLLPHNV